MISLYLKEFIKIRGFSPKPATLMKWGITFNLATRLLGNKVQTINFKTLETLCVALDCLPNDILNFTEKHNAIPKSLEIHKLTKKDIQPSLSDFSKILKPKQMEEVLKAIDEVLKKG